ncbi:MAG: hypothetical protein KDJ16_02895 [Hyphomicrobiales bacterium]|nr:hypothetical protein [Hyphomicrobiales bacterium]
MIPSQYRSSGGMLKATAMALAMLFAAPAIDTVRADAATDFLAALSGSWKGRGVARQGVDAAEEAILCRITSKLGGDGTKLTNSGNCAAAQTKIKIGGELRYSAATATFIGNLLTTGGDAGSSNSSGRLAGSSLRLKTTNFDTTGKVTARGVVVITPSGGNRYVIEADVTDVATGKTYRAAKITFSRSK